MMENQPDLEPRSALKQAGSDCGIPYGDIMGYFVAWAEMKMYGIEYSESEVETAMCIWEWALEQDQATTLTSLHMGVLSSELRGSMDWRRRLVGTAELRRECLDLAACLDADYHQAVAEGYDDAFDWEYVPWFMRNRVDFESMKVTPGPVRPTPMAEIKEPTKTPEPDTNK